RLSLTGGSIDLVCDSCTRRSTVICEPELLCCCCNFNFDDCWTGAVSGSMGRPGISRTHFSYSAVDAAVFIADIIQRLLRGNRANSCSRASPECCGDFCPCGSYSICGGDYAFSDFKFCPSLSLSHVL